MQFIRKHIEHLIAHYPGQPPLSHYLKAHYKAHPKLGSRDRRAISEALYLYYRVASFVDGDTAPLDVVAAAINVCQSQNALLQRIFGDKHQSEQSLNFDKPYPIPLSQGMQHNAWFRALLQQSKTFIRIRKNEEAIKNQLEVAQVVFEPKENKALALPAGTDVAQFIEADSYVVQDLSSQRSLNVLQGPIDPSASLSVWDACSGAGGKSLLLKDRYPNARILCTDLRPSILHNLRDRARLYGLKDIKTQVLDAAKSLPASLPFDLVLCDVPCSGSGTWARTPEQFYFFKKERLAEFHVLQCAIAQNAVQAVKPKGYLLYITCSVFYQENEEVVEKILAENPHLHCLSKDLLNGIAEGADSMFVALLQDGR